MMVKRMLLLCLTIATLSAPAHAVRNTRQPPIGITPGESCQQLSSHYPSMTDNDQQYGINFCSIKAINRTKFPLTLHHGKHSLTVPFVNRLKGVEANKRKAGIEKIHVTFAFSNNPTIMHDDAKRALFAMFRQMQANGWKTFILPYDARLRGRDTLINQLPEESKPFSMDAIYEPTLAEWMNMESMAKWRFYADHLYINISFQRNSEKLDPSQPGEYLFMIEVKTGETQHREYFESEQHEQWCQHWVKLALEMRKERERAKADARRIGLHIDTRYQDPPLPAHCGQRSGEAGPASAASHDSAANVGRTAPRTSARRQRRHGANRCRDDAG